jgi:SAM-dependent methyltransferase
MNFEDHFSKLAEEYSRHRPGYPDELFQYLASLTPEHKLAWDCGTGSGQAASGLARYYQRVIATDGSAEQIAHAARHPRIEYRVETAEKPSIETGLADLVTVAVAVHWFDHDRFYAEVRRVLKAEGILAVWGYHLPVIDPQIDRAVRSYYSDVLDGYWPERFYYLDERYETLPSPFEQIRTPAFQLQAEWNLEQLAGFLVSWSATRRFLEKQGRNPLEEIWEELSGAWGDAERRRTLQWPLFMRVGKMDH